MRIILLMLKGSFAVAVIVCICFGMIKLVPDFRGIMAISIIGFALTCKIYNERYGKYDNH